MSHPETFDPSAFNLVSAGLAPASILLDLATSAENAGYGQQESCIAAAQDMLAGHMVRRHPDMVHELLGRCAAFTQARAFESAVIALLPPEAVFTTARLVDGAMIAQVQLAPGGGAHSRRARWLAMALLAALLRAVATEGRRHDTSPEAA